MNRSVLIFLFGILLYGCSSTHDVKKNIRKSINFNTDVLSPKYYLYHASENQTKLYFDINPNQVLFSRKTPDELFKSELEFSVVVFLVEDDELTIQDTIVNSKQTINEQGKLVRINGEINMPLLGDKDYELVVTCYDSNKNEGVAITFNVPKSNRLHRYNFMVTNDSLNTPLFNYEKIGEGLVEVDCERCEDDDFLIYPVVKEGLRLPPPPFSNRAIFVPSLEEETHEVLFFDAGYSYFITTGNQIEEGVTITVRNSYFPEVKSLDEMTKTVRYISSKAEFEMLNSLNDQKKSIDDFWKQCGGSKERARQLIKVYYSRVEMANRHFSNVYPGWKTDRGLIYIVYGKPQEVRKTELREFWVYGDITNPNSLSFTFNKKKNIYSDNHFVLERNGAYRPHWERAVSNWRNGRIYDSN